MDNRTEIRDFLATRRARITPEQAGLLPGGGRRRVPGLRREEVAVLAGVSTDWYTRLEKGHIAGVSEDVLEAVARALQLDEAERVHLFNLARAAKPAPRTPAAPQGADPAARAVDARLDDRVGGVRRQRPPGHPRDQHPGPGAALTDVRRPATVGELRPLPVPRPAGAATSTPTGRARRTSPSRCCAPRPAATPHDKDLRELVGELSTVSEEFRTRWAAHDVRIHHAGAKQFRHPAVGDLELIYHTLDLPTADDGTLALTIYTAEPGTASEDGLKLLASWAATTAAAAAQPAPSAVDNG